MKDEPGFRVRPLSATAKMPDRVTSALLGLIRGREYPPGARLPSEMAMARHFGVSRTVIREAVSRLKSEGLVRSRQGSGLYVTADGLDTPFRIDPAVVESERNVLQVAELRRGLEAEMAALAAERRSPEQLAGIRASLQAIDAQVAAGGDGVDADMEFHRSIARATNNPHFLALWDFLGQFLKGSMVLTRALEARHEKLGSAVRQEHRALLDAIVRRDPEAARQAARHHAEMAALRFSSARPPAVAGSSPSRPMARKNVKKNSKRALSGAA